MTQCQLYLISPLDVGGDFPQRLIRALDAAPVAAFQFRVKGLDQHEAARLAEPLQAICAARGSKCSYIDLREYTDDGSALNTYMPYCRALAISNPGSGAGPIAGADGVHNTHAGAEYLWRIVWERGMRSLGIDTRAQFAGPLRKAPKPFIRGRGWM